MDRQDMALGSVWTPAPHGDYVGEEHASKRINPWITAEHSEWGRVLCYFNEQLESGQGLRKIMFRHFTAHEAELLVSSDRADLKQLQKEDTERYHVLVSGRFENVEQNMALKLAMVHFGLPVEPIFPAITSVAREMDNGDTREPLFDAQKPLHFLTAHSRRNWGRESLRGREATSCPTPLLQRQGPLATLRGGEGSDSSNTSDESDEEIDESFDEWSDEDTPGEEFDEDHDFTTSTDDGLEAETSRVLSWKVERGETSLYGYQGTALFYAEDPSSYESAIRNLLSLRQSDAAQYTLVQFDKSTGCIVKEFDDTINHDGINVDLTSVYNRIILSQSGSSDPWFVWFVKLTDEESPHYWEPLETQIGLDVAKINLWPLSTRSPHPYSYLPFPKALAMGENTMDAFRNWGANQYLPDVRTAFEVLIGRPDDLYHGPVHQLFEEGLGSGIEFLLPGSLPTFEMHRLHPSMNGCYLQPRDTLDEKELAFILPNYPFPERDNAERVRARTMTEEDVVEDPFPNIVQLIRQVVTDSMGGFPDGLEYVRLLPSRRTIGSLVHPDLPGMLVSLRDKVTTESEFELGQRLGKLMDDGESLILLHPVWEPYDSFMYASWAVGPRVNMPSLSSSVDEFIFKVMALWRLSGGLPCEFSNQDVISIKPYWPPTDEMEFRTYPATFYIDADTTESEWFSIRAQITSRCAEVDFVEGQNKSWQGQIAKSNVWGPRYGLAAENHNRWSKAASLENVAGRGTRSTVGTDNDPMHDRLLGVHVAEHQCQQGVRAELQEDQDERSDAYTRQPSIYDAKTHRATHHRSRSAELPLNAPPKEHMLRTSGSVPQLSRSILTPSEKSGLKEHIWNERCLALKRIVQCPSQGCEFTYRPDEKTALSEHLRHRHAAAECMWCDSPSSRQWDPRKRMGQLRREHRTHLIGTLGLEAEAITGKPSSGVMKLEKQNQVSNDVAEHVAAIASSDAFCDRCGRDRRAFANEYEESHHDELCVPGSLNGAICTFCRVCGYVRWSSEEDAVRGTLATNIPRQCSCTHETAKVDDNAFCVRCGINLAKISPSVHFRFCQGYASDERQYCTRCGTCVGGPNYSRRALKHIEECRDRPDPNITRWTTQEKERVQRLIEERERWVWIRRDGGWRLALPNAEGTGSSDSDSSLSAEGGTEQMRPPPPETVTEPDSESLFLDGEFDGKQENESSYKDVGPSRTAADLAPEADNERELEQRGRRAASPDWSKILPSTDPSFRADENYYCSKCLRKCPKRALPSEPAVEEQIESHIDKNLCCRIRNGIGDAVTVSLPNRSGWIPAKNMPKPIQKYRDDIAKSYPAYASTLYPLRKKHQKQSIWASDPNNESNKKFWALPWPPCECPELLPKSAATLSEGHIEGDVERLKDNGNSEATVVMPRKKSTSRALKNEGDETYKYTGDSDSSDELPADVDDRYMKRKKSKDPTFKASTEQESDEEENKRTKKRRKGGG